MGLAGRQRFHHAPNAAIWAGGRLLSGGAVSDLCVGAGSCGHAEGLGGLGTNELMSAHQQA